MPTQVVNEEAAKANNPLFIVNLETGDTEVVDPETGEILEIQKRVERGEKLEVGQLSRLAYLIVRQQQLLEVETAQKEETLKPWLERIDRIIAQYSKQAERRQTYIAFLTSQAELIVRDLPERKAKFRGVGTFSFAKSAAMVLDEEFKTMDEHTQASVRTKNPECFRVKYEPEKKVIREKLESGANVPGFAMREVIETFKFKEEK